MKKTLLLISLIIVSYSCQKDESIIIEDSVAPEDYSGTLAFTWNQVFLEAERFTPGYRPPVSARNNGLMNLIAYESIVQGSRGQAKSLSNLYPGLEIDRINKNEKFQWEVVLHAAYTRAFELYFPKAPSEIQIKVLNRSQDIADSLFQLTAFETFERSKSFGEHVANAVYTWSAQDVIGHEAYDRNFSDDYIPPSGIDKWQPTFPDFLPGLLPNWGNAQTFSNIISLSVPPPPAWSLSPSSKLYKEASQTMVFVNEIKQGQHEEDLWIAEFWSDDCPILTFSPAGRWVSIALQALQQENANMMQSVTTLAKVGMALSDAGIGCWREKYRWNRLRPIDYIRAHIGDTQWNTVMCPDGSGNYFTPNFPAYPSGHAAFGGAAAYILSEALGYNYTMTDYSHNNRTEFNGKARTFSSFEEMAAENAYSRIPLGVHFKSDSDEGLLLGYAIGARIAELPWE